MQWVNVKRCYPSRISFDSNISSRSWKTLDDEIQKQFLFAGIETSDRFFPLEFWKIAQAFGSNCCLWNNALLRLLSCSCGQHSKVLREEAVGGPPRQRVNLVPRGPFQRKLIVPSSHNKLSYRNRLARAVFCPEWLWEVQEDAHPRLNVFFGQ